MDLIPVKILSAPSIGRMDIDWIFEAESEKELWMTPI